MAFNKQRYEDTLQASKSEGCRYDNSTYKECSRCNEVKLLDEFYVRKRKGCRDTRVSHCKECQVWISKSKNYNISFDDAKKYFSDELACCAICRTSKNLVLDHNHETNEIRGILCNNCNTGLGMFEDEEVYLRAAIKYLKYEGRTPLERKIVPFEGLEYSRS